ncbi:MAG: hypothetical protein P5683_12385 [Limnospira sp. PMC 1279.21]|uniref:hypothetical protein n=1 Tax=unclassified Limnospira TaxID=2642885 RepID=UPI0012DE31D9|nr:MULTISPECIES: hypothetical protein [unclassified Limnospira]MDT9189202.1 hypothetical protein [Limnospira sp. PMC 894.15]MDT9204542.1 hypothetical protein [Limnospira sp. PMC 1243.20]MDT9224432.1 hypothetical protein [Limnospira sp. PMC 1279.21]MDT9321973.1 hypothetical protein [Limnospira sp. PMC 1290.21]MDT9178205.1 hypothetical protein [Limnospira sp. PMC 1238.20]
MTTEYRLLVRKSEKSQYGKYQNQKISKSNPPSAGVKTVPHGSDWSSIREAGIGRKPC